jgi:ligand-binding sensor domain-containing protein
MRNYCLNLFIQFVLLASVSGQSTINILSHYKVNNGLCNNFVHEVIRDNRGFLWISTRSGLSRFDGYEFETLSGKFPAPHYSIDNLQQDIHGNIWFCSSEKGIENLTRTSSGYIPVPKNKSWPGSGHYFAIDRKERVWIATIDSGIFCFLPGKTEPLIFDHTNTNMPLNHGVTSIRLDKSGNLWMNINGIMSHVNTDALQTATAKHKAIFNTIIPNPNPVVDFYVAGHILVIARSDSILLYNILSNKVLPVRFCLKDLEQKLEISAYCAIMDSSGKILIGLSNGMIVYDPASQGFHRVYFTDNKLSSPYAMLVHGIYIDKDGTIWIATEDGLLRAQWNSNGIHSYKLPDINIESAKIRCISEIGKDTFLAGINGKGLFTLAIRNDRLEQIKNPIGNALPSDLSTFNVIFKDSKGRIWIGSNSVGLFMYDKHKPGALENYEIGWIWAITEDENGIIWVGTSNKDGLHSINPGTGVHTDFHIPRDAGMPQEAKIFHITRIGNILWLSTHKGLYYFNTKTFKYNDGDVSADILKAMQNQRVWYTSPVINNCIYISTETGLWKLDLSKKNINLIESEQHIFYSGVYDGTSLWLITDRGLASYNIAKNSFVAFNPRNGLVSDNLSFVGTAVRQNGELVFAGENGFSIIQPGRMQNVHPLPKPAIVDFRIFDKEVNNYLEDNATIEISHNNNFISFSFSALDLDPGQNNRYAYRLDGLDKDWNYCGQRRMASYTDLKPGEYVFNVIATNGDGTWNRVPSRVRLVVTPPYWQTWWFKLCLVFVVSGIVFLIIYLWVHSKNRVEQFNRKIAENQLKSLRSQINPHFIFNSINSIQDFIFAQEPRQANLYLTRFASLMRKIIENSRKELISLKEENEFMEMYLSLEQLRFDNAFKYRIDVAEDIDMEYTMIPTMIIQPLAENAIKHGLSGKNGDKFLLISYNCEHDFLKCIIEDNGIGRQKSRQYQEMAFVGRTSIGISNISERLQLLKYKKYIREKIKITDLYDGLGQPCGTRVELIIPLTTNFEKIYDQELNR